MAEIKTEAKPCGRRATKIVTGSSKGMPPTPIGFYTCDEHAPLYAEPAGDDEGERTIADKDTWILAACCFAEMVKVPGPDGSVSDADLYHELSIPFPSSKDAAEALDGFHTELRAVRRRWGIPDLICAWRVNVKGGPGDGVGASMGKANMGDGEHALGMAAWLFGHEQSEAKRVIDRLCAGR